MPKGSMNSRQLEGLVCAGALDGLEPDRAKLFTNIDMLLAVADAANRERESGQAGLFGGEEAAGDTLRLKDAEPWSRADRMAKERENFGFYFSAHPVEQYRAIASANGARSYQSLMEGGGPAGGRQPAVMAAMVEKVNKGRTRRGGEFVRADFSDSSGQFSAACFEESLVENFQKWAAEGTCVLLNVELDSPSPDEPPRVTVRGARPLDEVKSGSRMMLTMEVASAEALTELKLALAIGTPGYGEVLVRLKTGGEGEPLLRLGRDYQLDGELAERLAEIDGLDKVSLTTRRATGHLRLVA
jgi:DNA polymerase-3 subunit alpha